MARPQRMDTDAAVILSITNWTGSKASSNQDRGASALEGWLANKAQRPIIASQVQGDVLQIQVAEKDKGRFLHMDGWRWAGVDVKITQGQLSTPPKGPRNQSQGFGGNQQSQQRNSSLSSRITGGPNHSFNNDHRHQNKNQLPETLNAPSGPRGGGGFQQIRQPNGQTSNNPFGGQRNNNPEPVNDQLEATLGNVVRKRYNAAEKFLDLSSLATDPDIQAGGLAASSAEKVFRALFVVCEKAVFETREKRADMIQSVSFKGNGLNSVKEIIGAASTFYKIKNLDLSDNNFQKITDLTWWKNRFPGLEQIILAGNPVDSPRTRDEVRKWYKNLQTYNMQPLNAPFAGAMQPPLETIPPVPTSSPAPGALQDGHIYDTTQHPEFPPGSTFGMPMPDKPADQLLKEQMGLKFSYNTGLKMKWVEECLVTNNFDYERAMNDLNVAMSNGNVPADAFIQN